MGSETIMIKISNLNNVLDGQENEWRRLRGEIHMIQLKINSTESDLAKTRSKLSELHRQYQNAVKREREA